MNFEALQMLIKSITLNYSCGICNTPASEKDIFLSSAKDKIVELNVVCPKCKNVTGLKFELMKFDLNKIPTLNAQITTIKNLVKEESKEKTKGIKDSIINDNLIVNLDRDLKKSNVNVNDLFN